MSLDPATLTEDDIALAEILARTIKLARKQGEIAVRALIDSMRGHIAAEPDKEMVTIPSAKDQCARFLKELPAMPADWINDIQVRFANAYTSTIMAHGQTISEALASTGAAFSDLCMGDMITFPWDVLIPKPAE